MKSIKTFTQNSKKMKQSSLSGMTVKNIKIPIKIRTVANGYYPISLTVLRNFMSL